MPVFDPLNSDYPSGLLSKIGETLYLNSELADVHFVFESNGESKRVPAHKSLLMAGSDVFATMFNGSWKENKEVRIGDSSAAAFEDFLQFFYYNQVQLSMENVAAVMNLGEMYNVTECSEACSKFLMNNLSDDNVCRHYGLAILYNQEDLKKACETFIGINIKTVFKSTDFLSCDQKTLAQILKLDWMSCTEIELFEACMAWVRSSSKRDVVSKKLVVSRLRDSFYDIRFGSMSFEQFATLIPSYGQLFVGDDYATIIQMIADSEFVPNKFSGNRDERCHSNPWENKCMILCDRLLSHTYSNQPYFVKSSEITSFTTDKPLLLRMIRFDYIKKYRSGKYIECEDVPTEMKVVEVSNSELFDSESSESDTSNSDRSSDNSEASRNELILDIVKTKLKSSCSPRMDLSTPVLIRPGFLYEIRLKLNPPKSCVTGCLLRSTVQMEDENSEEIIIQFHNDPVIPNDIVATGLVTELCFCSMAD